MTRATAAGHYLHVHVSDSTAFVQHYNAVDISLLTLCRSCSYISVATYNGPSHVFCTLRYFDRVGKRMDELSAQFSLNKVFAVKDFE